MPRRETVRRACDGCRKKRTKCDGQESCARCKERRLDCAYDRTESESKGKLRSRIQNLKQQLHDSDTLLQVLSADSASAIGDSANHIIASLRRGETKASILRTLNEFEKSSRLPGPPSKDAAMAGPTSESEYTVETSSPSTDQTPESQQTHSFSHDQDSFCTPDTSSSVLDSLTNTAVGPSGPCPAFDTNSEAPTFLCTHQGSGPSQIDTLNTVSWMKSHASEYAIPLLLWDAIPLCIVNKKHFIADLGSQKQFCSSALLSTLLALAARLKEQGLQRQECRQGNSRVEGKARSDDVITASDYFLQELHASPWSQGNMVALPDIQSTGVLALYQASFGQENEAHALADGYVVAIANLCFSTPTAEQGSDWYSILIDTYRGAIILQRLLRFTNDPPIMPTPEEATGKPFFTTCKGGTDVSAILDDFSSHLMCEVPTETISRHCPRRMLFGMVQLTEWLGMPQVQSLGNENTGDAMSEIYFHCLNWYSTIIADQSLNDITSNTDDEDLRLVIFTHMLYHYTILRSLSHAAHDINHVTGALRTRDICQQAAQSILSLAGSINMSQGLNGAGGPPGTIGRAVSSLISAAWTFLTSDGSVVGA